MTSVKFTTYQSGYPRTPTFEPMFFPAGEAHVKYDSEAPYSPHLTVEMATITSASGDDLMLLSMWSQAVDRLGSHKVIVMPYLPGARSDHKHFIPLGAAVYADLINSFEADVVICFDPHSEVMPGMINNCRVIDSTYLIRDYVIGPVSEPRYHGIIAPDAGARTRATAVANAAELPVYFAQKHRDPDTGQLSGFSCEELPAEGNFLVVDDICDGGGTFMGLASATGLPKERLGLYVSHGVFSGGAARLLSYYGEIWTTDSFARDENDTKRISQIATILPIINTLKDLAL